MRALHGLVDAVNAARLWRECAQLGLWAAPAPAPAPAAATPPPQPAAAEPPKTVLQWAPWAQPEAKRRAAVRGRKPVAAFVQDDEEAMEQ